MSVRIKYDINPEFVKPKLDDFDVKTITLQDYNLKTSSQIASTIEPPLIKEKGDSWYNWTISLKLEGIDTTVKGAENFFKTLNRISETITQLLKVIRLLSGSVNSTSAFLKFAIKQLSKDLKEFVNSLASAGIYSSLIIPDFNRSFPNYSLPTFGGYQEFITRVNATCLSSRDPDAPRFEEEDKVGGVIIAMLGGVSDPDFLRNLLDNFKKLSELFGFMIPYPSPAQNFKAIPGFYNKGGKQTLGVKLTWDSPDSPIGSFYVYRSNIKSAIPYSYISNNVETLINVLTKDDPIAMIKYYVVKPSYSYIDFDVKQESTNFYKIYSVFGDDYLDKHPYLKAMNSPIATPVITAEIPRECIPISELKKYMSQTISGELKTPFNLEGDWQSVTIRNMIGSQLDSMYNNLDALSDKLIGLVNTGSDALTNYLKFYGERVEDLMEVINKFKNLSVRLASFTQRGTFMVMDLPLEKGGMRGFVDRFNKACNSGTFKKETPKNTKDIGDFLKDAVKIEKNVPIGTFNDRGIMFGLIFLYGIPDPKRIDNFVPESQVKRMKNMYISTDKAITTLLKMLGLR
jgi:hypothetical protein